MSELALDGSNHGLASHHRKDDWSDWDTHSSRPHASAAIKKTESALTTLPGTQGVTVDIGANEVAPVLAGGRRGPSWLGEPLIGIYAWVQADDGRIDGEINYDMTAEQARELAGSLSKAADQLDAINN